jgi:carbamoyl-phosphate synthase large subunit
VIVLFLGAGKRLSLLEAFQRGAREEGVELTLVSVELGTRVPIAAVAEVVVGPSFSDPAIDGYLADLVAARRPDLIIPNMDSATVALSRVKGRLDSLGAWSVVSSHELCVAMEDKARAESWFRSKGFRVPENSGYPRILKRRKGFSSRGQVVVSSDAERTDFLRGKEALDYFEQRFVEGPEYTVDAYVSRSGRLVGALSRRRLKVLDGEVEESLSERKPQILEMTRSLFSEPGWEGPLTAQFIEAEDGPVLIEVNPRFGGGVTHAIHCGLDFTRWLIREKLGRSLPERVEWKAGSIMTRCRRDVFL